MQSLTPKISIVGCGNVGMRYAYATVIKGLARELVLVDREFRQAEGHAMDLNHGAPYYAPVVIRAGSYEDIVDSDLVVVTAGIGGKVGQTRLDYATSNIKLFKEAIIPNLIKYAPHAIYLIVSNPVDVLSYITYKLSDKPWQEVIGSGTVLDSARLRHQLSKSCHIDPRNIHAYILGEHGDSEFAV
ncbi:MAG TPA: hypothetical protein ENN77_00970 [Candidatus Wirthbacteria bacterium]|nr:hypothetical protein [Candidatus Wirthbacteria bacterium]